MKYLVLQIEGDGYRTKPHETPHTDRESVNQYVEMLQKKYPKARFAIFEEIATAGMSMTPTITPSVVNHGHTSPLTADMVPAYNQVPQIKTAVSNPYNGWKGKSNIGAI